jgi:isoquinoline 1-oxidoreductase beta subunit
MDNRSVHGLKSSYDPSRRGFLIAMLGAGVTLGFARCSLAATEGSASAHEGSSVGELFEPTIWYSIDPGGEVTINITRAEMGQHVGTALARIVADELEADWGRVRIITVDSDPKWGEMVTGGSWSVWQSFPVLSRAGAAGRLALVEEGAKLLGVSKESCTGLKGAVHAGREIDFLWRYCGSRQSRAKLYSRAIEQNPD